MQILMIYVYAIHNLFPNFSIKKILLFTLIKAFLLEIVFERKK
jgi:hypothetical protein